MQLGGECVLIENGTAVHHRNGAIPIVSCTTCCEASARPHGVRGSGGWRSSMIDLWSGAVESRSHPSSPAISDTRTPGWRAVAASRSRAAAV